MSAALSKRSQNKKKASAQGSLKFREVSNSFWEGGGVWVGVTLGNVAL